METLIKVRDAVAIPVTETSQVGEVRRAAADAARQIGFNETDAGKAAIIGSELASNLAKYAQQGEVILSSQTRQEVPVLDLWSVDKGPGMASPQDCLRDGFSTGGSAGTGLGSVLRLSTEFDLYSRVGQGTAILSRLAPSTYVPTAFRFAGFSVPKPGELCSGDAWAAVTAGGFLRVAVVDGLGHGAGAAEAARETLNDVFATLSIPGPQLMDAVHRRIRHTRGAAVAIADIDTDAGLVRFTSIGNVAGHLFEHEQHRQLVSHHGTVGHIINRVQAFEYAWTRHSVLFLHSDGLGTRHHLDAYPGLLTRHPGLLSGVLYRDFTRRRDDVTVLAIRENP